MRSCHVYTLLILLCLFIIIILVQIIQQHLSDAVHRGYRFLHQCDRILFHTPAYPFNCIFRKHLREYIRCILDCLFLVCDVRILHHLFFCVRLHAADYAQVLDEIRRGGNTEKETRLKLSAKAYTHTAEYDAMIATYMRAQAGLNEKLFLEFDLVQSLRYGENPHQSAKFYREEHEVPYSLAFARQLNGKELSYNNIQDANAALCIVREFSEPFCVGLKHMNPCGAATGKDVVEAWTKAYEADKVSIFGGIVATNREVTREAAELMKPIFLEIIMAPKFSEGALEVLCTKKNLRLLEVDMSQGAVDPKQYVSVNGGLLVQDLDVTTRTVTADMCVTEAKPAEEVMADLNFGWHIVKHVKSNAIVVVRDGRTLGVGAGQMNRIGSAEIALKQARAAGFTEGLVLASDGFFPFDDCVALAAEYGVTAIVQPGGSVRDEDSIRKANEKGIAMLFTGERHFKH